MIFCKISSGSREIPRRPTRAAIDAAIKIHEAHIQAAKAADRSSSPTTVPGELGSVDSKTVDARSAKLDLAATAQQDRVVDDPLGAGQFSELVDDMAAMKANLADGVKAADKGATYSVTFPQAPLPVAVGLRFQPGDFFVAEIVDIPKFSKLKPTLNGVVLDRDHIQLIAGGEGVTFQDNEQKVAINYITSTQSGDLQAFGISAVTQDHRPQFSVSITGDVPVGWEDGPTAKMVIPVYTYVLRGEQKLFKYVSKIPFTVT